MALNPVWNDLAAIFGIDDDLTDLLTLVCISVKVLDGAPVGSLEIKHNTYSETRLAGSEILEGRGLGKSPETCDTVPSPVTKRAMVESACDDCSG